MSSRFLETNYSIFIDKLKNITTYFPGSQIEKFTNSFFIIKINGESFLSLEFDDSMILQNEKELLNNKLVVSIENLNSTSEYTGTFILNSFIMFMKNEMQMFKYIHLNDGSSIFMKGIKFSLPIIYIMKSRCTWYESKGFSNKHKYIMLQKYHELSNNTAEFFNQMYSDRNFDEMFTLKSNVIYPERYMFDYIQLNNPTTLDPKKNFFKILSIMIIDKLHETKSDRATILQIGEMAYYTIRSNKSLNFEISLAIYLMFRQFFSDYLFKDMLLEL